MLYLILEKWRSLNTYNHPSKTNCYLLLFFYGGFTLSTVNSLCLSLKGVCLHCKKANNTENSIFTLTLSDFHLLEQICLELHIDSRCVGFTLISLIAVWSSLTVQDDKLSKKNKRTRRTGLILFEKYVYLSQILLIVSNSINEKFPGSKIENLISVQVSKKSV